MKNCVIILFLLSVLFLAFFSHEYQNFILSLLPGEKFNEQEQNWDPEKIKRYIYKKWSKDSEEAQKAIAIFSAESNLSCTIENLRSKDIGVAQINVIHWNRFGGKQNLTSCKKNIDAAYTLYKEWGNSFNPWVMYNNGRYIDFMP